jgi:DNA-binding NarL/FixJ family response regulator
MPTKIIIADDHPLILKGIKGLFKKKLDYQVIGTALSLDALMNLLKEPADILILDLNIHGISSLTKIEIIRAIQPKIKILLFTSYNKPSLVRKAFAKGVDGYILKDTDEDELIIALDTIVEHRRFIGSNVVIPKRGLPDNRNVLDDIFLKRQRLTKREVEVMNLVINDLDNQQIAKKLFISKHTVQSHRKNIFKKMEIHSVTELLKLLHNL